MKKRKLIRSILVENGYGSTNNAKSLTFNGETFPYQIIDPVSFNSSSLLYFYNQDGYVVEASLNTIEPRNRYDKISGFYRKLGGAAAGKSHWFDENKGYIVGNNGTIIYTEDAGDTYTIQNCPTIGTNNDIYFTNENIGWICGQSGTILKTTDASNWVQQSSTTTNALYSIYFHDSNSGISIGASGTILKTINGGETWTGLTKLLRPINNPLTGSTTSITTTFYNIQFYNSAVGYACGQTGTIIKTIDGGNTWLYVRPTAITFFSICVKDENEVWVCGDNQIWKTTDGGLNCIQKTGFTDICPPTKRLTSIMFDTDTGYCFGNGMAFKTTDNGENWDKCAFPSSYINPNGRIKIFPNKIYYTGGLGDALAISIDESSTWNYKIPETIFYSNPPSKISIIDENNLLFQAGISSSYYEYINGQVITHNFEYKQLTPYFLKENNIIYGWGFNNYGSVYKTTNSSNSWELCGNIDINNFLGSTFLIRTYFYSKDIGFIVSGTYLHKTIDGGSTWTYISGVSTLNIYDINFISPGTGFICGSTTILRRTNDSGTTWTTKNTGISSSITLSSVKFLSNGIGFCCGSNGVIAKSTNYG